MPRKGGLAIATYCKVIFFKEINGQKSSKWTETDETFWKINVQHQPNFTDKYTGNSISESDYTPPHLQPKQLD